MESVAEKMFAEIEAEHREVKRDAVLTIIAFFGLVIGVFAQYLEWPMFVIMGVFALVYISGGVPAAVEAFDSLRKRSLDINVLMILAALAAAGVGEVRDGAILLFLFSFAGTLEGYAMGNTKRAVAALMKLRPDEAHMLLPDGTTKRVRVEVLEIGQQVVVRPGERIPVDGVVVSGAGAVDQSSVTGESVPVDKEAGDSVFASTVNQNAVLTVRVAKTADQSTIARMIELVTKAQAQRSPSERFSHWFGERYTIAVLLGSVAMLVLFLSLGMSHAEAFYKMATLLVVASPCAIVISVPAAVLSAIAAAARHGVLFKGGAALEDFGSVDVIAFDKTGTLTEGKMQVTEIVPTKDLSTAEVLALAVTLEAHSEHPLAQSIRQYAEAKGVTGSAVTDVVALPGKGVVGTCGERHCWAGNRALLQEQNVHVSNQLQEVLQRLETSGQTTILVGRDQEIVGVVAIADVLRESATATLAALRTQGVERFVMLTGDTETVARTIGKTLGLQDEFVYGALLPEDKVRYVKQFNERGHVAFVGDGVNDAAALAVAHTGVAMGVGGSDVAIEAADIALLSDDLSKLAYTHALAKRANRIIKQNLIFAVGIMALMIVVTIFGHLPLPLGVIGHEGGTLLVVANGLRLLFQRAT